MAAKREGINKDKPTAAPVASGGTKHHAEESDKRHSTRKDVLKCPGADSYYAEKRIKISVSC